jgi:uncharacterized protein YcbK (DUF882 family)
VIWTGVQGISSTALHAALAMLGFAVMTSRMGSRLLRVWTALRSSQSRTGSAAVVAVSMLYVSCGASVPRPAPTPPVIAVAAAISPAPVLAVPLPPEAEWAVALPPLKVECANSGAKDSLVLYARDGSLDPQAVDTFSRVSADFNGYAPLQPRLVQLAAKAAYHFHASSLVVVSGYRQTRGGKTDHHTAGEALDFKLPGVDYRKLAAYLRSFPLVGVGVYTNPKTQYVHLDVRDRSYHWLDASPPGITWREALLPDPAQATRDASYTPESDLPIDGHE